MRNLDHLVLDYLVVGREVGEEGTPHLQGYVVFKAKKTFNAVKKLLPGAHLEVMKGSPQQASDYCKKDGDFEEHGTLPPPKTGAARGKLKADYAKAIAMAVAGNIHDIEPGLLVRHYRTLQAIARDLAPVPGRVPPISDSVKYGLWLWGPAGTGKSRSAREWFESETKGLYLKRPDEWWDGFTGTGAVLLEDLDLDHARPLRRHLKIWADMYRFNGNVKGGQALCRPDVLIVTSQYSIDSMWQDLETREAMHRRFCSIEFPSSAPRLCLPSNLAALSAAITAGTSSSAASAPAAASPPPEPTLVLSRSPSPTTGTAPAAASSATATVPRPSLVRAMAFCGQLPPSRAPALRMRGVPWEEDTGAGVGTGRT